MAISEKAGGASAAAADLARLRGTDTEVDPEEAAMVAAGAKIFGEGEKIMRALKLYEPDHPTMKQIISALHEKLAAFLDQHASAILGLQGRELVMEGHVIYAADRIDANIWFPLFAGGIRQLTFSEGIDVPELLDFFAVLSELHAQTDSSDTGEDDAVTMMWERDFNHIAFVSIDSFVEGADDADNERLDNLRNVINTCTMKELGSAALTGAAYAKGEVVQRLHTISLSRADLVFLRKENLATLTELPTDPKRAAGQLFQIDDKSIDEFVAGCTADDSVVERYLEALLSALPQTRESGDTEALTSRLRDLFTVIVAQGHMDRAHQLLDQLRETRERTSKLDGIEQKIVSEEALASIVAFLASGADDQETDRAIAVVRGLSSWAARVVIAQLGTVADRALRQRLIEAVADWGDDAAVAAGEVIGQAADAVARELVGLLQQIGSEKAIAALGPALRHSSQGVRLEAMRIYFDAAPLSMAATRARASLRDADSATRRLALEFVVNRKPDNGATWLLDRIKDSGFSGTKLVEKKRLLLAYARVGGKTAADWLLGKLKEKSLLGRGKNEEVRGAAALALAHLRHEQARPLIEQLANKTFGKESVKTMCAEALHIYASPLVESRTPTPSVVPTTPGPSAAHTAPSSTNHPVDDNDDDDDDVALIVDLNAPPSAPTLPGQSTDTMSFEAAWAQPNPAFPVPADPPVALENTMPAMPAVTTVQPAFIPAPPPTPTPPPTLEPASPLDLMPDPASTPAAEEELLTLLPEQDTAPVAMAPDPETPKTQTSAEIEALLGAYLTEDAEPKPEATPTRAAENRSEPDDAELANLLQDYLND